MRDAIQNSLAVAANVSASDVSIDAVSDIQSNSTGNTTTGVNIQFHLTINNTQPLPSPTTNHSTLTQLISQSLNIVISIVDVRSRVSAQRDTTPPVVTAMLKSSNSHSSRTAGPGDTISLTVTSTSEPLMRIDVFAFIIADEFRYVRRNQSAVSSGLNDIYYVVQEQDPSGNILFVVQWSDAAGNTFMCQSDNRTCVSGDVTVDTTQPTLTFMNFKGSPSTSNWDEFASDEGAWIYSIRKEDDIDCSLLYTFDMDDSLSNWTPSAISTSCESSACDDSYIRRLGVSNSTMKVWIDVKGYRGGAKLDLVFPEGSLVDLAGNNNADAMLSEDLQELEFLDQ
jgi:hypothetical protein